MFYGSLTVNQTHTSSPQKSKDFSNENKAELAESDFQDESNDYTDTTEENSEYSSSPEGETHLSDSPASTSNPTNSSQNFAQNPIINVPLAGLDENENPTSLTTNSSFQTDNSTDGLATGLITCELGLGAGDYTETIQETISCSTTEAKIFYCVAQGICCHPKTQGSTYVSSVTVGQSSGQYCLTYFAETPHAESAMISKTYNFDAELPHLLVEKERSYFQTTQLHLAQTQLISDNYGKEGFEIGQMNFGPHDPGPDGLNLSCDEKILYAPQLTSPYVAETLLPYSVQALTPLQSLQVFLDKLSLSYGKNHLVTYMSNKKYFNPYHTCQTTEIFLEDFPYFEASLAFNQKNLDGEEEFVGLMSPFGFFEEENSVYRGPAGSSLDKKDGQSLKSGLLSIFYL